MPTISVNVPEKMKDKIEEMSKENMYSNTSEYIRAALRKQIQQDTGLTPEEERIVSERMEKMENREEGDYLTLDEARKKLDIDE
ncbi:ribbon-helix-helix protein, CopG family [Nanohaloarchaea archaeon]|nr:ribbon-helix-helix protein, CopG family [Candidatus Nanohaloarchaea archaeon]